MASGSSSSRDVDLLLEVERGVVDVAALEDGLEGLRAHAVTGAQAGEDRAPGGDAKGDRLLDFLPNHLPRGEIEGIVGEQVEVVVVEADGVEMITQGQAGGELLAELFVHGRQGVVPVRKAEMGAEFAQEIVFRDELLFEQGADGGGLLGAGRGDGLDNGVFVAEARLEGKALEQVRGHGVDIAV